jgi:hypothetical protein
MDDLTQYDDMDMRTSYNIGWWTGLLFGFVFGSVSTLGVLFFIANFAID